MHKARTHSPDGFRLGREHVRSAAHVEDTLDFNLNQKVFKV